MCILIIMHLHFHELFLNWIARKLIDLITNNKISVWAECQVCMEIFSSFRVELISKSAHGKKSLSPKGHRLYIIVYSTFTGNFRNRLDNFFLAYTFCLKHFGFVLNKESVILLIVHTSFDTFIHYGLKTFIKWNFQSFRLPQFNEIFILTFLSIISITEKK